MRPVVTAIRRCDRDLGDQIRRAASSVALNVAEGNRNEGGLRLSRFSTAAGSNAEVRAALRVAVAWGYFEAGDVAEVEQLLDRVGAMLHRLGARRCTKETAPGAPRRSEGAGGRCCRYFTMSWTVWLQLPSPVFVTGRYRNSTVTPGVKPVTVVAAWRVDGAITQVFPPSVLNCHS